VQSIKEVASEMGKSIVQVTDTNSQLASTATNFKDTLLKSNSNNLNPSINTLRTDSQANPT
jgi:Trp operon repressor